MLHNKKNHVTEDNALHQITRDNVTTVLVRMNGDAEMIFRREHDRADPRKVTETPYTRAEYEAEFGALGI